MAEKAVMPGDRQHHHTGQDNRQNQGAAGALFERAGQFLDGEHDARQRRVEGRRHPGGAAGHDQGVVHVLLVKAADLPHRVHHRRAHMNAGSLAADAGAAQQPHAGERELHDDNAERQKGGPQPVIALFEHHQHLGNTAALGLGAGAAHHEHGRQHPQRCDQHRPQRRVPLHLSERLGAQFRHPGEPHGDQTDHQRADPEHHPHLPVLEGAQLPT